MEKPLVTIVFGVPKSGKTTWINNNICGSRLICSAYHHGPCPVVKQSYGWYLYGYEMEGQLDCLKQFIEAVRSSIFVSNIAIDGAGTSESLIGPYVSIARAYELPIKLVLCPKQFGDKTNPVIKGIQKQLDNLLVNWPKWWPEYTVALYKD